MFHNILEHSDTSTAALSTAALSTASLSTSTMDRTCEQPYQYGDTVGDQIFDHDRLDVYRLAIEYTSNSFELANCLTGHFRHARDQWIRAAQSIPLNIAEGNGKRGGKDRARFFDIARGSAFECAAIQDVLVVTGGMNLDCSNRLKLKLKRIVSMLTTMAISVGGIEESRVVYRTDYSCEAELED